KIPIWIADYVMMGYGTGAIMAVPAHDTRDFEFAAKFNLPIVQVVQPPEGIDWHGYVGDGIAVNSGRFDGLPTTEFKQKITAWLEEQGLGQGAVNHKLRDWLFSRQRYWGEPFPIVHDARTGEVFPLDESELPVELPPIDDYRPQASDDPNAPPAPPLGRASEWASVRGYVTPAGAAKLLRLGQAAPHGCEVRDLKRELNTMPQWAGSCWYYLRYLDPANDRHMANPDIERYWMAPTKREGAATAGGIDLYVGGAEHAVLHLLYSRFWHKVLYDLGHVSTPEPFGRLFNQGYIQAYAYQDERGMYVSVDDVEERTEGPQTVCIRKSTGRPLTRSLGKMGKSLKNAVAPDDICHTYGTDTLRAYEMYMGPLEASKPWSTRDIVGMSRFLLSVWKRFVAEDGSLKVANVPAEESVRRLLHKTIKRVTGDMQELKFNTAIAALIELNNALKGNTVPREVAEPFVLMLSPIAPHLCEELWHRMQGSKWRGPIVQEPWPRYEDALCVDQEVEIAVQVLGKVRSRVMVPADASEDTMREIALADTKIQQELTGKTVRKVICIPGRLVNIVAN
ncbi:MAG TPA: class I tRNA ligase family protein, partial [Phycisphaerae bacterium]|nr:class I tRNA ligase family protein [Phycisphaerae bacterium]